MALTAGTRLGPYEILEPLGAGGMGEVYRARDSRLGRDVALKILPQDHATDSDRLRRFESEARTVASLDHPHILSLHDIGTLDGVPYAVTELLEGRTLRKVLVRGPLPPRRVVDYGVQICRGLAAAHGHRVVHRDVKPENLFLTRDGQIKILDFGLARLGGPAEDDDSTSSQVPTATEPGLVVGTAGYMSPEQAGGRPADARSDIFSLGAVLYEMLSGQRAFRGETTVETMNAILNDDPPPLSGLDRAFPPALARVITRCLEKQPGERFQSARDVAFALEALATPEEGASVAAVRRPGRRWALRLIAAGVLAIPGVLGWWLAADRSGRTPMGRVEITPLTADGGLKRWSQLSPDGEKVAYAWTGPTDDSWDIYVKALGVGTKPLRLTDHPGREWSPAWSPDGRQIAFLRELDEGGAIYTVPSMGGQERKLTDFRGPLEPRWRGSGLVSTLSWSADGGWLAFAEKASEDGPFRIVLLSLGTRQRRPVTSPSGDTLGDFSPSFSPDGRHLAFLRSGSTVHGDLDLWVQPREGGEPRRLTSLRHCCLYEPAAWAPDGDEIFFQASAGGPQNMWRVSLDGGDPQLVPGVGQRVAGMSVRGTRMVHEHLTRLPADVWRVPGPGSSLADRAPDRVIASGGSDSFPDYSPDGQRIAFVSNRSGGPNIWVCTSEGSDPVQLTDFRPEAATPRWSPDGRRIAFDSPEAGDYNVYVIDAEGGMPRRLTPETSDEVNPTWSRDSRWIYFTSTRSGRHQIWKVPAEGGPAVQVTRDGGYQARESWDGRDLYYAKANPPGIWRRPADGGEESALVHDPRLDFRLLALSRSGVYFAIRQGVPRGRVEDYAIHLLAFDSGQVTEVFRKKGPFLHNRFAVSPDEGWILYSEEPVPTSELILVENFR